MRPGHIVEAATTIDQLNNGPDESVLENAQDGANASPLICSYTLKGGRKRHFYILDVIFNYDI